MLFPRDVGVIRNTKGHQVQFQEDQREAFTQERQDRFLTLFSATSNIRYCSREIGIATSTIHHRRRHDPVFRAAFAAAQEQAVVSLRAEMVSRGLALLQAASPDEAADAALSGMDAKLILSLIEQYERSHGKEPGDIKPQKSDAGEATARLQALLIRMRLERQREMEERRKERAERKR
ncbi:hypothetical protein GCM10022211_02230 [Sphingomonas humi]|uniref:Terminase small subunit n=1 Tax=Sphingomonas humi TaxID=335630 RepID=A0ABP7RFH0_9SPHN